MLVMARTELGMSTDDFYSCTWYDWSLWAEHIRQKRKRRDDEYEFLLEITRTALTTYYNWNRGNQEPLAPQDLWTLSYDKARTDTEPTEEEKKQLEETIRRLESKSKRKRGRNS